MLVDLILKPSCSGCGSTEELYGSNCKHLTLCVKCGKSMAENSSKCCECGTPITHLIKEYNVHASSSSDKSYFVGKFTSGLPNFNENKWLLQKEGRQGRQVTDALRDKNKAWYLEDETGQSKYIGNPEGSNSSSYYLLMPQGNEFVAIPADSWYNFKKQAQYKTLSLEEAEERMKNRRKNADGYERWMMKVAHNGAAAFGEVEKPDDREGAAGGGRWRRKTLGDEEEDDDDDIEKGDDWEHIAIFTDDDEAVGNDPEDREDLAAEIHAPPELKQDDEDNIEGAEAEGGLSRSGKELNKLLGRAKDFDAEDDDFAPPPAPPTEDEIRAVLLQKTPLTVHDLIAEFKHRLKLKEDRIAFSVIVKRISLIRKTNEGNLVVLRER